MTNCQYVCVKPLYGVVAMPENDYRCMPVEGCQVPLNNYYRKLLKEIPAGRDTPQLQRIDCETGEALAGAEWLGVLKGSFSNMFNGAQVLNLGSLLAVNNAVNPGVHSVDIDIRTTQNGVVLTRGHGVDLLYEGDSRSWKGFNDGIGNLGNATEFTLVISDGDEVVINWEEIGDA